MIDFATATARRLAIKLGYRRWSHLLARRHPTVTEAVRKRVVPQAVVEANSQRFDPKLEHFIDGLVSYYARSLVADLPANNKKIWQSSAQEKVLGVFDKKIPAKNARILYVGPSGFREGVWNTRFKYIFPDLFEPLADRGAKITMLTGSVPDFARDGLNKLYQDYGVEFIEIGPKPKGVDSYQYWAQETIKACIETRPHVLSNVFGGILFGFAAGIAAHVTGTRSVPRIAGDEIASRLAIGSYEEGSYQHRRDELAEYVAFNLADAIIVMSPHERTRIRNRLLHEGKAIVCQRGVDLDFFIPPPTETAEVASTFAYVGRKSLEKGYDIIEEAAKLINADLPQIRFNFAGTFEPGQEANIHYHGFVEHEDLPEFYRNSEAFILCSRTEGFPTALMEAMATGRPCIVSRHLFSSYLKDDEDALLVDCTPEAVVKAIRRLATEKGLAQRLSARSRQIALERYDREAGRRKYRSTILGTNS